MSLDGDQTATFKTSVKVVDSEQRLRELELELAQTKLSLVESECRSQDLEHRLAAIEAAAGESKSWFKRISLVKDAGKWLSFANCSLSCDLEQSDTIAS